MPISLSKERALTQAMNSNFSMGLLEADAQFLCCCELAQHRPTNQRVQKGGRSWQMSPQMGAATLAQTSPLQTSHLLLTTGQEVVPQNPTVLRVLLWPPDPRWKALLMAEPPAPGASQKVQPLGKSGDSWLTPWEGTSTSRAFHGPAGSRAAAMLPRAAWLR